MRRRIGNEGPAHPLARPVEAVPPKESVAVGNDVTLTSKVLTRFEQQVDDVPPEPDENLKMGHGFDRIVTSIFDFPDPGKEYEVIRSSLEFGENSRSSSLSYGELQDALDRADETAQRAAELLANAQVELSVFEIHVLTTLGAIREKALAELKAQKEKGTFTKTIANDDVEAMMAKLHPDEYVDIESRRAKAKRMVDVLKSLQERCVDRARHLNTMCGRTRAVD